MYEANIRELAEDYQNFFYPRKENRLDNNQLELIETIKNNDCVLIAKGRQLGVTTALCLWIDDECRRETHNVGIICAGYNALHEFMHTLAICPGDTEYTNHVFRYHYTGSTVKGINAYSAIDEDMDTIVVDEAAFVKESCYYDAILEWFDMRMRKGKKAKIIMASTFNPNPKKDMMFQDNWLKNGYIQWKRIKLTWQGSKLWDKEKYFERMSVLIDDMNLNNINTELNVQPIIEVDY